MFVLNIPKGAMGTWGPSGKERPCPKHVAQEAAQPSSGCAAGGAGGQGALGGRRCWGAGGAGGRGCWGQGALGGRERWGQGVLGAGVCAPSCHPPPSLLPRGQSEHVVVYFVSANPLSSHYFSSKILFLKSRYSILEQLTPSVGVDCLRWYVVVIRRQEGRHSNNGNQLYSCRSGQLVSTHVFLYRGLGGSLDWPAGWTWI